MLQPIGSPIPPRPEASPTAGVPISKEISRRISALLTAIGIAKLEDVMPFILSEDYSALPPKVARRLRDILSDDDATTP